MDNFTYTSPHTGQIYTVVPEAQSRVDYREYMNPETKYIREYTQYSFFLGEKRVAFTFDFNEKHLSDIFGELEGVYAPWTTSARD